jgi:GNAT superfamily N-acetyltransferase
VGITYDTVEDPASNADKTIHLIRAYRGNEIVGEARIRHFDGDGMAEVTSIAVNLEERRHKIGTRLYERAAKLVCERHAVPLASDTYRSAYSDGFWQKQVRKGRATCLGKLPYKTKFAKGDAANSEYGRSGCKRYILTCPAPPSLAGVKRKR